MNDSDRTVTVAANHEPAGQRRIMNVGFIGWAEWGAGMAANLLKAGHRVTVFNRTPAKAEALVAQGANAAISIAEACQGDAVITMLANDEAVESVALGRDGIVANLRRQELCMYRPAQSASASSQQLAQEHARRSQRFVAAPFGRPDVAAAGKLFVVAGGEPAALKAAAPLVNAFGQLEIRHL